MKILVKVNNWVGDVVMNLPALQALRHAYPQAHITVLARPWVKQVFHFRQDLVDSIIDFEDKKLYKDWPSTKQLIRELRQHNFDLGIAFTRHLKGASLLRLAGIPTRIGFSTAFSWPFLNRPLNRNKLPEDRHQSRNYLDLLRIAANLDIERDEPPVLHRDQALEKDIQQTYLQGHPTPLLVIHPGSAKDTAKRWSPKRFGEVARDFLSTHKGTAVVLGVDAEADAAQIIQEEADHPNLINLIGKCDLRESIAFTALADMVLANDSGMMHVAAAFQRPQVAIFGPTNPKATFPLNPDARVLHHSTSCSPCKHRHCPIGHDCMNAVTTYEANLAVNELMTPTPAT